MKDKPLRELAEEAHKEQAALSEARQAERETEARERITRKIINMLDRCGFKAHELTFNYQEPRRFTIEDLAFSFQDLTSHDNLYLVTHCEAPGCQGERFTQLNTWDRAAFLASIGSALAGELTTSPCAACEERKEQAAEAAALNAPEPPPPSTAEQLESLIERIAGRVVGQHVSTYHYDEA